MTKKEVTTLKLSTVKTGSGRIKKPLDVNVEMLKHFDLYKRNQEASQNNQYELAMKWIFTLLCLDFQSLPPAARNNPFPLLFQLLYVSKRSSTVLSSIKTTSSNIKLKNLQLDA